MTTGIEQELKELLTKHLPQAMSETLQQRLKQADVDAATVERQKEQLATLNTQINDLQAKLNAAKEELKQHGDLATREKNVAAKENQAEIAALKVQLEASQGNTKFAQDVALGLVRNVEYRRHAFDSENRSDPIIGSDGYQRGSSNTSVSRSTNTSDTAS